jgi:transcriptional regulator with XRE-family HTH domain
VETVLQKRLRELMAEKGLKAAPLARAAQLGESYVRDILRGRAQYPTAERLARLAEALDTTPDYLTGMSGNAQDGAVLRGSPLEFAGFVQAGAFRPVDEYFNQDGIEVPEFVTAHKKYKKAKQFAWRVVGSSMDQANLRDGMWVVGVKYNDFLEHYGDIESGRLVVVERKRYGDSERELTVKEVKFYRDRMELLPRSSDPSYKPIVVPHNPKADSDAETVTIIAVVVGAFIDLA